VRIPLLTVMAIALSAAVLIVVATTNRHLTAICYRGASSADRCKVGACLAALCLGKGRN
jgi:hypothetical protein